MISASDRENAVLLINEAIASGASCKKACYRLGITERTFYRWKKRKSDINSYEDGRPTRIIQSRQIRSRQKPERKS